MTGKIWGGKLQLFRELIFPFVMARFFFKKMVKMCLYGVISVIFHLQAPK